ncbi:hypothetical protein HAX54_039172, partial [Datura stramonium]|nr:hypothetical protein [Datura stramonium]
MGKVRMTIFGYRLLGVFVLDEIINYVQSLQRQVEFGQQTFETNTMAFGSQGTSGICRGTSLRLVACRLVVDLKERHK